MISQRQLWRWRPFDRAASALALGSGKQARNLHLGTAVPETKPTLESLAAEVKRLSAIVLDTPRMTVKDVLARYGITKSTFYRWCKAKLIPPPVRIGGPRWRLADLQAAEIAGQLPRPVSA